MWGHLRAAQRNRAAQTVEAIVDGLVLWLKASQPAPHQEVHSLPGNTVLQILTCPGHGGLFDRPTNR